MCGQSKAKQKHLNCNYSLYLEATRGSGAQSMTVKSIGCGFDPHSGVHTPEFGRKWGTVGRGNLVS